LAPGCFSVRIGAAWPWIEGYRRLFRRGKLLSKAPRARLCVATFVFVLVLLGGLPSTPSARAACSGSNCPGSGYTYDRYWNCGLIYNVSIHSCYFPGVLGNPQGYQHTWGWASADYDGGGTVPVGVQGVDDNGSVDFGASGSNLARACYYSSCNDNGSDWLDVHVYHGSASGRHTIYGHAKA